MAREILATSLSKILGNFEGLTYLSLPKGTPTVFITTIVTSVNAAHGDSYHAFHVSKIASDNVISPEEATGLRSREDGSHSDVLVISREGEFKDLKSLETFRHVNPALVPSGLAGIDAGEININAVAYSIASEIARAVETNAEIEEISIIEMGKGLKKVLCYLAEVYLASGNHDINWKDAWWVHARSLADNLLDVITLMFNTSDTRKGYWGCRATCIAAGLPVPANVDEFYSEPRHGAKVYAKKVQDNWNSGETAGIAVYEVEKEARKADRVAPDESYPLTHLDWIETFDSSVAGLGHPVLAVSQHAIRSGEHSLAWANVDENDFFEMSADNLEVSLLGNSDGGESKPLPSVSLLEPPVFISPVGCGSFSADLRTYNLGTFTLLLGIPVDNLRLSDFKLTAAPTALQVTLLEIIESDDGMVLLRFEMEVKIAASGKGKWREKPYQLSIAPVISNGRVPFSLLSQISVLVPFPGDDASFYLTAKFGSKTNSKQKLVSLNDRSYTLDKTTSTMAINEESLSRVATFKADQSKIDLVVVNKSRDLLVNGKECELIKLNEEWAEPHLASSISLVNDLEVRCGQNDFSVHIVDAETRPLSPIAAAAQGTLPTEDESWAMESELLIDPRGVVERWMSNFYQGEPPNRGSLGQVVMLESENARKASISFNHDCNFHVMGEVDNFPIFHSGLLDGAIQERFWEAFDNLGLADFSQGRKGLTSDWPSRLDLRDLEKEKIERYIDAYESLVDYAIESEHHGLLVYPFSVLIFNPAKGVVTGVLLSPLHPIRLAWNWATQVSAKEVIDGDIDIDASDLMRFVDGTSLPFYGPLPFNLNSRSVAVGLDPGIEELFATWSYLCDSQITESSNSLPLELSGYVFPAAARSGLDRGGVTAAINDYLRVYPYSSDLRLGLFAQTPVPRSKELDRAVVSELDVLLKNRASQLPGGIRVLDSKNRLGQMPGKDYLLSKINAAVDYLDREDENKLWKIPFEWKRADEGNVDMRFMEESLVKISHRSAGAVGDPISTGAMTMLPVRRSYAWTSVHGAGTNQSRFNPVISTQQDSELPALLSALNKVEKWDRNWETWCDVPNSSALTGRGAKWIVSGNSHIDPRLLAKSLTNMQQDKVLWEWRPPFFPRRWKGAAITGAKPYTVIATLANDFKQQVTSELSNSIGAGDDTLNELFKVLGTRGVGIASLLSMGHRQSRGAIGFYLGFLLGARWEKQQVPDEIRMVLPLDAVNPVFETLGGSHDDERKKADLLMISAKRVPDDPGAFAVDLRPIEIKLHAANDSPHPFPSTSSSVVKDALKQVRNTLKILQGFINVAMSKPCPVLVNTVISALVEMGISLSAHENQDVELCRDLLVAASTGKCNFTLSGGLLLWFERHGTGNGNNPFILRRSTGNDQVIKFFVDPASLHSELKSREEGELVTMLMEALGEEGSSSPSTETSPNTEVGPQVDIPDVPQSPETEARVRSPDAGGIVPPENPGTGDVVVVESGNTNPEIMPIPSFGKLDEVELHRKLNLIIDTLEQLGVSVFVPDHVPPFTEGPASIMFRIAPSPGVSINAIKAKMTDLKLVLHLKKQQEPRHFIEEGCFVIDVPKKDSDRYYISAQKLWESWQRPDSELAVPVGLDAFKEVVELNFSSPNSPHLLIGGTTGSGKSEALNTILYGLAQHYDATELRFSLIDPKGTELIFFSEDPHLDGEIGLTADDAKYILERAVDEMDKRYALFVNSRVNGIKPYNSKAGTAERMPWWVIVLDEYADLTSDKEMKKEIEALLQRLAQKARAAGIHVIVATQKPTVDVINTVVRSNLPAQLALRVNRAIESRVIIGEDGAEALTGKGDALLNAEGQLTRFQSAMYEQ